jgi:hypothetical protein
MPLESVLMDDPWNTVRTQIRHDNDHQQLILLVFSTTKSESYFSYLSLCLVLVCALLFILVRFGARIHGTDIHVICYALGFIFVARVYLFLYLSVYVYHRPALPLLPDYFGCCRYLDT